MRLREGFMRGWLLLPGGEMEGLWGIAGDGLMGGAQIRKEEERVK